MHSQSLSDLFNTEKQDEAEAEVVEEDIGKPIELTNDYGVRDKAFAPMVVDEEEQEQLAQEVED